MHWAVPLVIAILLSAAGVASCIRGARIHSRLRKKQCVACGHPLAFSSGSGESAALMANPSGVCNECGRSPDRDRDAQTRATALLSLGVGGQLVWLLLGATEWSPAAVLFIETSVVLLVFACEPVGEWTLRRLVVGRAAASGLRRSTPRRPVLRALALLLVIGGWSWIGWRYQRGAELLTHARWISALHPRCRKLVTNRTEWMNTLLPPGVARRARVAGLVAEVSSRCTQPLPSPQRDMVDTAWVRGSIARAGAFIDLGRLRELDVFLLTDEIFLRDDADRLEPMPTIEVLSLEGSTLSPVQVERLLRLLPNVRSVRLLQLDQSGEERLRAAFPTVRFEAIVHDADPADQHRSSRRADPHHFSAERASFASAAVVGMPPLAAIAP